MNIKSNICSPIEIHIKDKGEFTDVALLVDNLDFLQKVKALRDKYGLDCEYPVKDENKKVTDFVERLYPQSELYKEFNSDIDKARRRFFRPTHFIPVIQAAVIYGNISDGVYTRAYLEEQEMYFNNGQDEISDKKYAIVINAKTRDEDVISVLQEFRKKVKINTRGSDKERSGYQFGYWADLSLQKVSDTHDSIDRLHTWYVKTLKGQTPLEIALEKSKCTKEEYQDLKTKSKKVIIPTVKGYAEYKDVRKKIEAIWGLRDSIKTQLAEYRRLLLSANRNIL